MFKQAVDSHEAQATKKALAQQLFPSSSPPSQPQFKPFKPPTQSSQHSRPLSEGTGNILRTAAAHNVQTHGIKRTSSGLKKAVDRRDAFEDLPQYQHSSQQNPIIIGDASPVKKNHAQLDGAVYFDENDFDSDIELDVENPATKGSVSYPELPPPSAPVRQTTEISTASTFHGSRDHPPQGVSYPTLPRAAPVVRDWEERSDSGYVSQIPTSYREQPPPPPSSEPLPWSSSPAEHHKPPPAVQSIRQFTYTGSNASTASTTLERAEPRPTATKRRTLPWLDQEIKEEASSAPAITQLGRQKRFGAHGGDYTPLPRDTVKSEYPWNTTASAMKQQQKTLRETNKKLIKAHDATNESIKAAIADSKRKTVHRPFLSDEQQHVLDLVVEQKKSVFFTGSAGTGKSVLLREIIASLRKKYVREPDRVAVTASTGLAACNVGGVTLHSFAGFGLGKDAVPELVKKIKRNQKARHRWMRTKVLIIDEVSMVDGDFFDKLEEIARIIRNNGRPFGGIQLIITGDFFQLPPVPDYGKVAKFCFDAGTWNTSIEHTIGLHHVFRQKDPVFAGMLNEMREGRLSQKSINAFRQLSRNISWEDGMEATELFPTRSEVDAANNRRMQLLVGDSKIFQARDGGTITNKPMRDKLLQSCMAPDEIQLKKGAQVMLIKNIDDTLVNGSLGKVIGFMSEQTFDRYHEDEEAFLSTQAVGDEDLNPQERKLKSQLEIMASTAQQYPVVRFAIADGTTRDLLCQRETWKVELPNGEVQASRAQVPLILAWALSIHKAQGQTLERVKVDLGKVFEKGQAYVALSRATSMAGLQVLRFDPAKVMAHERVRNFYARLSRAETTEGGPVAQPAKKKSKLNAQEYERDFVGDEFADELEALAAYG